MLKDISPDFTWNPYDANVSNKLLLLEGTPEAIVYFSKVCDGLSDYSYWFLLSTLWVSYSGFSDLSVWKQLFSSKRPRRQSSIMKPSELKAFKKLSYFVYAYRAHRDNEKDWLSFTLDRNIAYRFAQDRQVQTIREYKIKKSDILCLFLRRGEKEILVLDKENIVPTQIIHVP